MRGRLNKLLQQVRGFIAAGQPLSAGETARTLVREALAHQLREEAADLLEEAGVSSDDYFVDASDRVDIVEFGAWVTVKLWVPR